MCHLTYWYFNKTCHITFTLHGIRLAYLEVVGMMDESKARTLLSQSPQLENAF